MNEKVEKIIYTVPEREQEALILSEKTGIGITYDKTLLKDGILTVSCDTECISLHFNDLSLKGDFSDMVPRLKKENLRSETLVKAAKIKDREENSPSLIDATAGLGEDSFLLAAVGFNVTMYEYDPIIAAMLKDALLRSSKIPGISEITARMKLVECDSITALRNCEYSPDVIYLDPMFPERQKSGAIKKKFQLLQKLESPCSDAYSLMNAAIEAKPYKIVVKRPQKGEFLAGVKPSYTLNGTSIRYDCYVYPDNK